MEQTIYRGAIFDLDGTLVDSMGVWRQIDVDFLGKRGLSVPPDYLDAITPMGFEAAADYTIDRFGFPETREEIIREWYDMAIYAYANTVPLKKGAMEYLQMLKEQNIKMAVATASDKQLVIPALTNNGVIHMFDNITTVQEVSRGKGFPDVYDKAAERMGIHPAECIVFEDILAGIQGAHMGGYRAVAIFDEHSVEPAEVIKENADAYIMDFMGCTFPL